MSTLFFFFYDYLSVSLPLLIFSVELNLQPFFGNVNTFFEENKLDKKMCL